MRGTLGSACEPTHAFNDADLTTSLSELVRARAAATPELRTRQRDQRQESSTRIMANAAAPTP
jgi:hypothetical protein